MACIEFDKFKRDMIYKFHAAFRAKPHGQLRHDHRAGFCTRQHDRCGTRNVWCIDIMQQMEHYLHIVRFGTSRTGCVL